VRERNERKILAPLLCGIFCACASPFGARDALTADQHHRFGAIYEEHGLPDDAIGEYKRAARLRPADPENWMAIGDIQFKRESYALAARYFRRALKVSPRHVGALNNLAMTYLERNKDLGEAERLAQEALRQEGPLKPYVLDTLAKIYEREGRLREASAAASQAAAAQAAAVQSGADAASRDVTLLPRP
jgi:Flp pilus assembly protein TadD